MKVNLNDITFNPYDPREDYGDLEGLKASIEQNGILQPFLVRPKDDKSYELVFGGRRLRCLKELGYKDIDVEVRELGNSEMATLALCENVHRKDLNPVELARAYRIGLTTTGLSNEQFSKITGEDVGKIRKYLNILDLPERILKKAEKYNVTQLVTLGRLNKMSSTLRISYENILNEREISATFAQEIVASCDRIFSSRLPKKKKQMLGCEILTHDYSNLSPKHYKDISIFASHLLEQELIKYDKNLEKVSEALKAKSNGKKKKIRKIKDITDISRELDAVTDILRQTDLHVQKVNKNQYYSEASRRSQGKFRTVVNRLVSGLEETLNAQPT